MSEVPVSLSRTRVLIQYCLIAFLVSWAFEIPLALKAQGVLSANVPFSMHYLAAFGPFVAALIMTWREKGPDGIRDLFRRMIQWKVKPIYWLVTFSPVLLFFLVSTSVRISSGTWLDTAMLNRFDFLPDIGVLVVFIWLATYGFGEEAGWRGFFLPRLQREYSAIKATFLLWCVWALWHAPSFFYLGTASSAGMLIGFLLGLLAGAIFLTWLYNSTNGSVLMVALWHGLFDYVTACQACKSGAVAATVSTLVMIWAVVVVLVYKRNNLSSEERHAM